MRDATARNAAFPGWHVPRNSRGVQEPIVSPEPEEDVDRHVDLLTQALGTLASAAVVLDSSLRVVSATSAARRILGDPLGSAHVVKVLGELVAGPLAEALARGRAAVATLPRAARNDGATLRVRATPLRDLGAGTLGPAIAEPARGWLLVLTEDHTDAGAERFGGMWTRDPAVKHLFALASKVAQCDAHVLLDGETGTGKGSFASAIHAQSTRRNGPLRVIACASSTDESLERQLLAGTAGAELTLFLDEITELVPGVQARLVRVLDSGMIAPLDGGPPLPVSVRVIAATRTSLNDEIARGRFRADLAYQLRVVSLHLPPLRARRGDVALLVDKLVEELNDRGGRRIERVAPTAMSRLERHDWPGNVRELHAALESAYAVGDGPVLTDPDLPREIGAHHHAAEVAVIHRPENDEAARIERALAAASGDRMRAAAILGMSRTTLWRRMRALGLLRGGRQA
jgi:transcriptional regulator of acetoin/glycerol metabolism